MQACELDEQTAHYSLAKNLDNSFECENELGVVHAWA